MTTIDVTSVLLWSLLVLGTVAITAIVSLVQILKWVLIGKDLLERRGVPDVGTGERA